MGGKLPATPLYVKIMDIIELPKYLYKYISWDNLNHRKIILDNEIYFSSVRKFNDPFDSTVPFRYELGSDEQVLKYYSELIRQENPHLSEKEVISLAQDELMNNDIRDEERISYNISVQREFIANKFGVFSASKIFDSILMWSHYANHHKGLCIRFDCQKFRDFMETDCVKKDLIIYWNNVDYKSEYPILNPYELKDYEVYFKSLLVKAEEWKYECEFRLILCDHFNKPLIFPDGIIDQVILGCRISADYENKLKVISKNKNIELLQAVLNHNSFSLEFHKVNV